VADARFAKPLDRDLVLRLARSHELLMTVEEGSVGGFGSRVLELLARTDLIERGLKVRTMALPDVFIDHDTLAAQYAMAGLDAKAITAEALAALGRGAQARQLAGSRR
jgi:1-deoxy-D-xylulose-5-phosphate synthase